MKPHARMAPVMTSLLSPVPAAAALLEHSGAWHCLGSCSPDGLCNQLINYCCSSPRVGFGRVPAHPWQHLQGENLAVGCRIATSIPYLVFPAQQGGSTKLCQQNSANKEEPSPSAGECEIAPSGRGKPREDNNFYLPTV